MFRDSKLSKYLVVSGVLHIIAALAISRIYAEQPQRHRLVQIKSVRIMRVEPEPEPPPKPKVVAEVKPEKKAEPKKTEPKEEPKVKPQEAAPPKVARQPRVTSAPAPGLGFEMSPRQSRSAPGIAGPGGVRGSSDELPSVSPASGIEHPTLTTKSGGTGLAPGTHGSMAMPTGSSHLPGAGGRDVAGFRMGSSLTGTGIGRLEVSGSGGKAGRSDEGPGVGISDVSSRFGAGGGKGTTGIGVGESDGMGEVDSDTIGSKPGEGSGGPGVGGYQIPGSRSSPKIATGLKPEAGKEKELPITKDIPGDKREGATGKKEFEADVGTNMTTVRQSVSEPVERSFEGVLQDEINKNLQSLRKLHEDWQNLKLPNIPKVLQITIELGTENGKPKLMKVDLHNTAISSRIKDDLTRMIKNWKFISLYDGKDDPEKWPVKLSGKISWQ